MKKLIIGMGLPGSGKSTTLSKFASEYGHEYISLDEVRTTFGLTRDQSSTPEVFDHIGARMVESYDTGKAVVLDGTFLNGHRKKIIDFARASGIRKIQGVFVDTSEDHAWARVQRRKKEEKTTRALFDDRLRHLKEFPPSITDGFDAFFVLNETGGLVKAEISGECKRVFTPPRR